MLNYDLIIPNVVTFRINLGHGMVSCKHVVGLKSLDNDFGLGLNIFDMDLDK